MRICLAIERMLSTVNFNDQVSRFTQEIDNVTVDFDLPAKLQACQAAVTQMPPQQALCVGRVSP
jgi:hypothetical protein